MKHWSINFGFFGHNMYRVMVLIIYAHEKLMFGALCARLSGKNCRVTRKFNENVDIAVATEKYIELRRDVKILLVSSDKLPQIIGDGKVSMVVSCGMNEKDTATFSSIDKDRAVLCVQRNIGDIECGEFPVNYDENISIRHNIAIAFCEWYCNCNERKE